MSEKRNCAGEKRNCAGATPTGAELKARREALKLSVEDVADLSEHSDAFVRRVEAGEDVNCNCVAAALDAEEARRAAEPVACGRIEALRMALARISDDAYHNPDIAARDALAADDRAARDEPVPPEGVTVRVLDGGGCTYISINRGCSDDLIATIWHGDALAISIEDEYATPEALEYVATLSRHIATQHAASDRQRKLDAVREAEEANDAARSEYEKSAAHHTRVWSRWCAAARALDAARKEAGL